MAYLIIYKEDIDGDESIFNDVVKSVLTFVTLNRLIR